MASVAMISACDIFSTIYPSFAKRIDTIGCSSTTKTREGRGVRSRAELAGYMLAGDVSGAAGVLRGVSGCLLTVSVGIGSLTPPACFLMSLAYSSTTMQGCPLGLFTIGISMDPGGKMILTSPGPG